MTAKLLLLMAIEMMKCDDDDFASKASKYDQVINQLPR